MAAPSTPEPLRTALERLAHDWLAKLHSGDEVSAGDVFETGASPALDARSLAEVSESLLVALRRQGKRGV